MSRFGDVGVARFVVCRNEGSPYNLPYAQQVKSCEETERKLTFLLD